MNAPAGVYACGCGGAHQLGTSCPVAVAADRDDQARDVAQLWSWTHPGDRLRVDAVHPELATLLDGLAEIYGLEMMTK